MDQEIELPHVFKEVPFLRDLAKRGIECDQLSMEAIRRASRYPHWGDDDLLVAFFELGSRTINGLDQAMKRWRGEGDFETRVHVELWESEMQPSKSGYYPPATEMDYLAIKLPQREWTSSAVIKAIIREIRRAESEGRVFPYAGDLLNLVVDPDARWEFPLNNPKFGRLLRGIANIDIRAEDCEFVLAFDSAGRIRVRSVGFLGDQIQLSESGQFVPSRALLIHHRTFGSFTVDQISELEELINSTKYREEDYQNFFEKYPHFFRTWDHRAVHPHVYLTRETDSDGPLIPDFILTHADAQKAFLVDLKLPSEKLIRRQKNRERFSAAITEAKAQLTLYRDWFDDKYNREKLKDQVGMAIYRPQLSVVIGRSSEFRDEIDRQRLRDSEPGLEVVTYDDILGFAKKRQLVLDHTLSK